jgi:hypothetical protein
MYIFEYHTYKVASAARRQTVGAHKPAVVALAAESCSKLGCTQTTSSRLGLVSVWTLCRRNEFQGIGVWRV